MNNVVDFYDKRVQKKLESITPEQQLKLYTVTQFFPQEHVTNMLEMADDLMPLGQAIDTMFTFVAVAAYAKEVK